MTNVFLYGSSGTGKTILSTEAVKIKISLFKKDNKPVRVIVTQFTDRESDLLLQNFRTKYFPNIEDIRIQTMGKLCEELEIKGDFNQPKDMINKVVTKLSEKEDETTILMCDELVSCHKKGQKTPDWRDVSTADNVVWILSVRPDSDSVETINLNPPSEPTILVTKLLHGHRNCKEIRSVVISSLFIFPINVITDNSLPGTYLTFSRSCTSTQKTT